MSEPANTIASPEVQKASESGRDRLFAFTILLSAFLLFQVQPVIGKYILPWFGGMPAVWNTCMLVFQVLLLLGYLYAHIASAKLKAQTLRRVHLAVLVLAGIVVLAGAFAWHAPLTPGNQWKPNPEQGPVRQIILLLMVAVGAPFFVLSTTSSLLQRWYSRRHGKAAYRLYAVSNAGSLLGLLSYPFFFEPLMTVHQQAWLWTALFMIFLVACGAVTLLSRGADEVASSAEANELAGDRRPRRSDWLFWITLPACASVLLLATTNMLCQEVAVVPLLWVLPLALYLLTFVAAFESSRWYRRAIWQAIFLISATVSICLLLIGMDTRVIWSLIAYPAMMFSGCMVLHGETARLKPHASHLTHFYLCISLGGAIGGVLVVLVAPAVFRTYFEFPLAIVATGLLAIIVLWRDCKSWIHNSRSWVGAAITFVVVALIGWLAPNDYVKAIFSVASWRMLLMVFGCATLLLFFRRKPQTSYLPLAGSLFAVVMLTVMVGAFAFINSRSSIVQLRNFFGVKMVFEQDGLRYLQHGRITHGEQMIDPSKQMLPTTYYAEKGMSELLETRAPLRVGIIGLGAGTLAAYARPGDGYRFYEIDPQVISLSKTRKPLFTFVSGAGGNVEIVQGDARLSLERELARDEKQNFDVLILDAFTSDAIPVHLLTEQAVALYLKHLRDDDSIIAFHISNRSLDLHPVVAGICERMGLTALDIETVAATWVVAAKNPRVFEDNGLAALASTDGMGTRRIHWTDSYSNLFQVISTKGSRQAVPFVQ